MTKYDVGDLARITGTWTDASGKIDPDVVRFECHSPSGVAVVYEYGVDTELVRDSLGVYHADVSIVESGWWYYRFWSTGSGQAAQEGGIKVLPKRL